MISQNGEPPKSNTLLNVRLSGVEAKLKKSVGIRGICERVFYLWESVASVRDSFTQMNTDIFF